ncbi:UNVERIFIED_CONTAM: hypothetical protein FKN15_012699 [Acipenser sinensis]
MKNRDKIGRQFEQGGSKGAKRIRTSTFAELDKALLQWFKSAHTRNLPMSGPILHEKAQQLADALGCENFSNSNSWLERWKKRNGIILKYQCGEAAEDDENVVDTVLVGAPVANSTFNPSIANPGAVYKCNIKNTFKDLLLPDHITNMTDYISGSEKEVQCGKTCQAERDNQWFGVSLSRQPQTDGYIVACGHRWKNIFYTHRDQQNKLPNGVCYKIQPDLNSSSQPMTPCYIDGLSDLLVGAPMYSTVREEGRVYIYMNLGNADMKELDFELAGSDSYSGRFGETITNLGDIDDDGFPAVLSFAFQRISGNINGNVFKMFGQSVSGGIDVDGNGYPDVAVGAFMSDSAVVLRTRVVVIVEAALILPPSVNRTKLECVENGQPAVCMNITLCFKIKGRDIPGHIGKLLRLHIIQFFSSVFFMPQ